MRRHPGKKVSDTLVDLLSGGGRDSFGKKGRKRNKKVQFLGIVVLILAVAGIVFLLTRVEFSGNKKSNTAKAVVEDDSFDPIKDYSAVRDTGNIDQLEKLLTEIRKQPYDGQLTPVKLDINSKKIEVSDQILDHPDCIEEQKVLAARTKMDALWQLYVLDRQNEFDDPKLLDRILNFVDDSFEDENLEIARDAHIVKSKVLVVESISENSEGSFDDVEKAMVEMLEKFPDDPKVIRNLRQMFTRIRASDSEQAAKIAGTLAAVADRSESGESRKLSRFMRDIILLYDCGIGNLSTIISITVEDEDFLARLDRLNSDLDAGITVINQLDNAVEYFERQRKYTKALELSRRILDTAVKRTDPEAADLAALVGGNGVERNSLIGNRWPLHDAGETEAKFAAGKVTLIFFCWNQSRNMQSFIDMLGSLDRSLINQDFQIVFIEVDMGSGDDPFQAVGRPNPRWLNLETELENPNLYLQHCPTRRFPYSVLIGRDGIVDSINITFETIKTRIDYLLSGN